MCLVNNTISLHLKDKKETTPNDVVSLYAKFTSNSLLLC